MKKNLLSMISSFSPGATKKIGAQLYFSEGEGLFASLKRKRRLFAYGSGSERTTSFRHI
jgi:hypothetical protein